MLMEYREIEIVSDTDRDIIEQTPSFLRLPSMSIKLFHIVIKFSFFKCSLVIFAIDFIDLRITRLWTYFDSIK